MEHAEQSGTAFLKGLEQQVSFQSLEDAEEMFVVVEKRLLDINNWHMHLRSSALKFQLMDRTGHQVFRRAHKEDLIMLSDGGGAATRWAKVDSIIYDDYPDEGRELFSIQLHIEASDLITDSFATLLCLSIVRAQYTVAIKCNHAKANSAEDHLTDAGLAFSLAELIGGLMEVPEED